MSGVAFDFTVNLPVIGGGAVFLYTIGTKLGQIVTKLEHLGEWHARTEKQVDRINGRVSHIEGHLGIEQR